MKKGQDIYEGEPSSSNVIARELPNDNECLFSYYEEAKPLGDVLVAGSLVRANPLFSCMLTVSSNDRDFPCIPDTLKVCFTFPKVLYILPFCLSLNMHKLQITIQLEPRYTYIIH